jgi:alpha-mannosidase
MPFGFTNPQIGYSTEYDRLFFNRDQLPGSNKEFFCVEKDVQVTGDGLVATVSSPTLCLYEAGGIIDENKVNGAKVWKKENRSPESLFLYVFNNYWHTNYKAYQEGVMEFEIELSFRKIN